MFKLHYKFIYMVVNVSSSHITSKFHVQKMLNTSPSHYKIIIYIIHKPVGVHGNPCFRLLIASLSTLESFALPSHLAWTYVNCMSWSQTHITLIVMTLFLLLNALSLLERGLTLTCVPSLAPTHF